MNSFMVPALAVFLLASFIHMFDGPGHIAAGNIDLMPNQTRQANSSAVEMLGWQPGPAMTVPRIWPGVVEAHGYLFALGGYSPTGWTNSVERSQIQTGGGLGPWSPAASLPIAADHPSVISYGDYIYYVGADPSSASSLLIEYARVVSGDLQEWKYVRAPLASGGDQPHAVAANGFLFVFHRGGTCLGPCKFQQAHAQRAAINPDGTLDPLVDLGDLGMAGPVTAVTSGNWIYLFFEYYVGGLVIYRAPVGIDGTLGSFAQSKPWPDIGEPTATFQGESLYALRTSCASTGPCTPVVGRASISTDGGLSPLDSLPTPIGPWSGAALAAVSGSLYLVGGSADYSLTGTNNTERLWLAPHTTALPLIVKGDLPGLSN